MTAREYRQAVPMRGSPGVRGLAVGRDEWRRVVEELAGRGARLLSLWADTDADAGSVVRAAFLADGGVLVVSLPVNEATQPYPGIEDLYPAASRLQRALRDVSGLASTDPDSRPWLRHASWPAGFVPLAGTAAPSASDPVADDYAFVRVEGDGVHEVPVGPVHAGIIEPGHFRFSIVGEKVLRLEQRLGYVHKGIERRFTELAQLEAHRLAGRVSGDSTVAYAWAYCQALEGASGLQVPARALWLRALALEIERIANHLGDLGMLANDAGFAFGLAQFSRLKERWLRSVARACGRRYLMDFVVPGGTSVDVASTVAAELAATAAAVEVEARQIQAILDEHAGVRDRFVGTGVVTPELAAQLGLGGLAGRASGQAVDLRVDLPCAPYDQLAVQRADAVTGDVAARVAVRFAELYESCRLVQVIVLRAPQGPHQVTPRVAADGCFGLGVVEGWRGPVLVALTAGLDGTLRRCHPHDPSSLNWPVLEHAVIGNIVPDFPLINKSFNLSYSGHDL